MKSIRLLLVTLLVFTFSCKQQAQRHRAFYFWKTVYALQSSDTHYLASLGMDRMYVRFFDITWDPAKQAARPVGMLQVTSQAAFLPTLVPVVFMTNETLQHLSTPGLQVLAQNTVEQIFYLTAKFPGATITQLQLDCDWTPTTKDRYFQFLKAVQSRLDERQSNVLLSVTIRLHQLRDRTTNGIPPVKRGVLMAYHTSSPLEYEPGNSILNLDLAAGYLHAPPYPIPLDPALPIFAWTIQYDANQRFIRLLRQVDASDFQDSAIWTLNDTGLYQARVDTYLEDKRIMAGDLLEVESNSMEELVALSHLLLPHAAPDATVLLFDYEQRNIQRITADQRQRLEDLLALF